MPVPATFFDGEFARDRQIMLDVVGSDLVFSGEDVPQTRWSIAGMHPVDPPSPGQPFRLTHQSRPGARLVIRDADFIQRLTESHKHLQGGYSWLHVRQVLSWTVGGALVLTAIGYLMLSFLPQKVAFMLPDSWRNRVGSQVVKALVDNARLCTTPEAEKAKTAMITVIMNGNPSIPPISMEVYDMQLVNAFAAPGGRIIFTRGILEKADKPDEIAGVLAHEIGHVAYRHPEAQLVRLTGVQVLTSLFSGGGGGDLASNVAAIATLLRYSRDAEREADAYARDTMEKASVDPMGLRVFFEKLLKEESGSSTSSGRMSALEKLGNVFSTHPGTEDRIKEIQPMPAGRVPVEVLSTEQWQSLKTICGS